MSGEQALAFALQAGTALLGAGVLLAFWRLVRGPSIPDRVLALDLTATMLVGATALYTIAAGETVYLRAAIVLALLSFVGTIAFAHFVHRRARP